MNVFSKKSKSQPSLQRVKIRNYKSIGKCNVELFPLTMLVGRNGAGKSNFLDALRFVSEGLQTSLDHAIKSRGGIDVVRRRSTGHPRNFAIELRLVLPDDSFAIYGFEIAARRQGGFIVKQERLIIEDDGGRRLGHYSITEGEVGNGSPRSLPPATPDRLYLVTASSLPTFRPTYEALVSMGFYNLNPDAMRELQSPDAGELLHRDGSNIASVIARLSVDEPRAFVRIKEYLARIVPGIKEVARIPLGPRETLEFRQEVKGSKHPWTFYATSMSDGTLRALGALTAVAQLTGRRIPVSLVGIEEPETALHPAATSALMDALREAAERTQVIVTSHSPDMLDQIGTNPDMLLVVKSREGSTEIAAPDDASVEGIKKHLYSPGELLRMDQLQPNKTDANKEWQMSLFSEEDES